MVDISVLLHFYEFTYACLYIQALGDEGFQTTTGQNRIHIRKKKGRSLDKGGGATLMTSAAPRSRRRTSKTPRKWG